MPEIINEKVKTELTVKDFDYELPPELIAQTPAERRDMSRLLVVHRKSETFEHRVFHDIKEYLHPGDTLVVNDSKVIPARLLGKKDTGADVEFLLLRQRGLDIWECIVHPGRRLKSGAKVSFSDILRAEVLEEVDEGNRLVKFDYDHKKTFFEILDEVGEAPLPPYITERAADPSRYQTVYAREPGSAAAPTAGFHFTEELLAQIKKMGVEVVPVMLHVGLGTFRPVKVEKIEEHHMHTEFFSVSPESAEKINSRRAAGGRTICVGTTSCRTIESSSDDSGMVRAMSGDTGIFIYPGYRFKATDALITNFHLPQSTLLMLVSALSSRELIMRAYKEAVENRYRFFSFGDAMFIE